MYKMKHIHLIYSYYVFALNILSYYRFFDQVQMYYQMQTHKFGQISLQWEKIQKWQQSG